MKTRAVDDPISERVRAALTVEDPQLVRDIEWLEKASAGKVSHVATNGKHPRDWSPERWLQVAQFVFVIVGGIWFAGGKWAGVEQDIEELQASMAHVVTTVERVDLEQRTTRSVISVLMREVDPPDPAAAFVSPRQADQAEPVFPRDERFIRRSGR